MSHATTGLLAGTDTRIQASQKMLNEFASKGITSFVDKSGRNWDLSSYAEMCVRTVGSHAALQGHIDRQIEVGEDLVKVSSIGTTCPICMRWQGVVLSISGNNPKYHSLDEAKASGLFHPNCKNGCSTRCDFECTTQCYGTCTSNCESTCVSSCSESCQGTVTSFTVDLN